MLRFFRELLFLAGSCAAAISVVAAPAPSLQNGTTLFHIGGCTNCHTARNGPLLAGGDAIRTPFGDFYAANITPDPETGSGGWSIEDLSFYLETGMRPDGNFAGGATARIIENGTSKLDAGDRHAIAVYLKSLPPRK